ncbi:hypothetical protein D3C72_2088950 [compost metagenome]
MQNTTLGKSPPLILRKRRRNSMPFITGMFQSSRMASGILCAQASMACLPSSASVQAKCSSSRIFRATLRTTRLSSTTRQTFMVNGPQASLCTPTGVSPQAASIVVKFSRRGTSRTTMS